MIEGESDYGQDGPLKAGMLGYYPEGVPYGPQVNKTEIFCAVLQFGGASGSGYLLPREVKAGMEELKAFGEFKDGMFHRAEGAPGRRTRDAYQAIWEHMHGREMIYPKGRYDAPIIADAANFEWAPVRGARRVAKSCSACGPSGARKPACSGWKRAQATRSRAAASIWCSRARANATASRSSNTRRSILIPVSEPCCARRETTELLHYGLPDLSDMETAVPHVGRDAGGRVAAARWARACRGGGCCPASALARSSPACPRLRAACVRKLPTSIRARR